MELSGNLREIGFSQMIELIAHLEGTLELWKLPQKRSAQLYIKKRKLRCVRVNGQFLDGLRAKAFFVELAMSKQGLFEFNARQFRTPCKKPLNWPLSRILLSISTQADEHIRNMEILPDPKLRFRLAKPANEKDSLFLRAAGELLQRDKGANAKEIANRLRLPVDQVRYYLHKLAERNKVSPAE